MLNDVNNSFENPEDDQDVNAGSVRQSPTDLPDSADDLKHIQEEEVIFDLPDVADIPGQEHVHVPVFNEMADTTISSDDEEGIGIFEEETDEEDADVIMGTDADVTPDEQKDLETTGEDMPTRDDNELRESALDNTDDEGDALNEGSSDSDISGNDLDTPGAEDDDADELTGEEDEENNAYSLGGDEKDDIPEDSF